MADRRFSFPAWLQDFPPGLDTETDVTELKDGFTPEAYGLDLDADNRLKVGSIPTGEARTVKTIASVEDTSGATNTYSWIYNRLWRIDGNKLYWGAQGYDNYFYPVGRDFREFNESATPILAILPFGEFQMAVFKSDVTYVLSNIQDTRDLTFKTDIFQEISIADATHAVELDGVVYASTSSGLKAFTGGGVKDLTSPVRDSSGAFSGKALTANYNKKWIIGAGGFAFDVATERLFDYSTSGFRWTSPALSNTSFAPFVVDRLEFGVEHTDANDAEFTLQIKLADGEWSEEYVIYCPYEQGQYKSVPYVMPNPLFSATFQIRIVAMDSNLAIRKVTAAISQGAQYEYAV